MKLTPALDLAKLALNKKKLRHSKQVAKMMTTKSEKRVALLHDVIEQNVEFKLHNDVYGYYILVNGTTNSLALTREEFVAIRAITRRQGESYSTYITRVKCCQLATKVKIADIMTKSELKQKHLKAVKALLKD